METIRSFRCLFLPTLGPRRIGAAIQSVSSAQNSQVSWSRLGALASSSYSTRRCLGNLGIMGKTSSNYHPGNPSLSFWGVLSTGIQPIININVETNHRFLLNPPFLEKCQSKPWLFPPLFPWFSLSRRKAPGGG